MSRAGSLVVAIAIASATGAGSVAWSMDYPKLVGTWKGASETTLIGSYEHSKGNPDKPREPTSVSVDFTLTLAGQEGRRVWGTIASAMGTEPWLGAILGDGKTLIATDTNGHIVGTIDNQDTLNLCYVQSGSSMVAGCTIFKRQ